MKLEVKDKLIIESLKYNDSLKPNFEFLKSCLIWEDEIPVGVSSIGYEFITDLWIIRGYIHREIPEEEWGLDPKYFKAVLKYAQEQKSNGLDLNVCYYLTRIGSF